MKQAFHEGWAGLWAQHVSAETATLRASNGVHAPGKWRTNGPLANHAGFGEVHGCKPGTPMQVDAGNRITLWPEPEPAAK